jgi:hypothetical protein
MKKMNFFFVVVLLIACSPAIPLNPAQVSTFTASHIPLTFTPTQTVAPTPRPTNTPTFTPTLTWTPLPTLPSQQTRAKIEELLETNGGCELPCWWGITPNETAWPETLHFLRPYIFQLVECSISNST